MLHQLHMVLREASALRKSMGAQCTLQLPEKLPPREAGSYAGSLPDWVASAALLMVPMAPE